jgi:hypothetical protein
MENVSSSTSSLGAVRSQLMQYLELLVICILVFAFKVWLWMILFVIFLFIIDYMTDPKVAEIGIYTVPTQ